MRAAFATLIYDEYELFPVWWSHLRNNLGCRAEDLWVFSHEVGSDSVVVRDKYCAAELLHGVTLRHDCVCDADWLSRAATTCREWLALQYQTVVWLDCDRLPFVEPRLLPRGVIVPPATKAVKLDDAGKLLWADLGAEAGSLPVVDVSWWSRQLVLNRARRMAVAPWADDWLAAKFVARRAITIEQVDLLRQRSPTRLELLWPSAARDTFEHGEAHGQLCDLLGHLW